MQIYYIENMWTVGIKKTNNLEEKLKIFYEQKMEKSIYALLAVHLKNDVIKYVIVMPLIPLFKTRKNKSYLPCTIVNSGDLYKIEEIVE